MIVPRIKILGIISPIVLENFKEILEINNKENEMVFFCDYSEYDFSINFTFNTIVNPYTLSEVTQQKILLKKVAREPGKPLASIPKGFKTICKFEFIQPPIPDLVYNLSHIDNWYDSNNFLYFTYK
jgi:hypothetical protein